MNKTTLYACLAFSLTCVAGFGRLCAQTVTWVGSGDGTSWTQASNWSPAAIPTATSDVVIPAGATAVSLSATASVRSLTLSRALNMTGSCPSLTVAAGITLPTAQGILTTAQATCTGLTLTGSQTISGPGRIALKAPMRVTGTGTTVTVAAGATVATAGSSTITVDAGASLVNQGTLSTAHGLTISGASLSNAAGASLSVSSNAVFRIATTTWTNSGTFVINNGYLRLGGSTPSLGTVTRTGGSLELECVFTGPSLTADATTGSISLITGFAANGVTFNTAGTSKISVKGFSTWTGCTVAGTVDMDSTCGPLTVAGGLTLVSGGSLTTGGATCEQLRFTGVQTISGPGQLRLGDGNARVFGAGAALTIAPGTTLTTASEFGSSSMQLTIDSGATLFNQGLIRATAGKTFTLGNVSAAAAPSYGDFRNQAGGVVTADSLATVNLFARTWTNDGTFNLNGGAVGLAGAYSTAAFGNIVNSNGTLQLFGSFATGSNFTVPTGPTLDFRLALSGVTLTPAAGALYRIGGGTLTNCTLNGASPVQISAATLVNCTLNAPVVFSGTVPMTAPVFNAPATLAESTITGGMTLNGVTLTGGNGYTRFNVGTQTISGTGTLVGVGLVVGNNATLVLPSTLQILADTVNFSASVGSNGRLDSSAVIHASAHAVNISGNASGQFINRGTITLVNNASLRFDFITWSNLGVIATSSGTPLYLGGVYSSLGTIDQTAGAPVVTLAGTFNASGPFDIDAYGPTTVFGASFTGATISSSSGRTFVANLGSSFTNCTFNTPFTIGGTSGNPVRFTNVDFYNTVTLNSVPGFASELRGTITLHNCDVYLTHTPLSFFDNNCAIAGTGRFFLNDAYIYGLGTSLSVAPGIEVRCTGSGGGIDGRTSPMTFLGAARANTAGAQLYLAGTPLTLGGTAEATDGAALELNGPQITGAGAIRLLRGSNLTLSGTYPAPTSVERDASGTGTVTFKGTLTGTAFDLPQQLTPALFLCNASGMTFSSPTSQTYRIQSGNWNNCTWTAPVSVSPNGSYPIPLFIASRFDSDVTIAEGTNVTFQQNLTLLNGHTMTLNHFIRLYFSGAQSVLGSGSIVFANGTSEIRSVDGTLTFGPGITVTTGGGDGIFWFGGGPPSFINMGRIVSTGTNRSLTFSASVGFYLGLVNYGSVEVGTGAVLVQQDSIENRGTMRIAPGGSYTINPTTTLTMFPGSLLDVQFDDAAPPVSGPPVTVLGHFVAGGTLTVSYPSGLPEYCQPSRPVIDTLGAGVFDGTFQSLQPPTFDGLANPRIVRSATGMAYSRLNPSDVGSTGAVSVPDGRLDNNDFIVFIQHYFSLISTADVGSTGGIPGPDGRFDNNDFIVFIDQFFAGC